MQPQDNTKTCYQRGSRRIRQKISPLPSKSKSIHYWISWSTWITKDPPNLVYPMYLSPPSSCYQRTSKSLVFTSFPDPAICPIPSAKLHRLFLANLQNFPSSKTLSTLWKGGLCLGTNLLSMYDNGRGKENRLQWFLTKDEQLSLSKRWVCCVVKTYLGFSL